MKKIIFFLVLAILILFSISKLYYSPEKRMLKDFAQDVINEDIKFEKIIDKYIICDKRAIEIDGLVLKYVRFEFNKNPHKISIYSYKEIEDDERLKGLVADNFENVYLIDFGEKLYMPILLNENSKIIAISAMDKGGKQFFITTDK